MESTSKVCHESSVILIDLGHYNDNPLSHTSLGEQGRLGIQGQLYTHFFPRLTGLVIPEKEFK